MKSKLNIALGLVMIVGVILSACQPQAQATQPPPKEVIKEVPVNIGTEINTNSTNTTEAPERRVLSYKK